MIIEKAYKQWPSIKFQRDENINQLTTDELVSNERQGQINLGM